MVNNQGGTGMGRELTWWECRVRDYHLWCWKRTVANLRRGEYHMRRAGLLRQDRWLAWQWVIKLGVLRSRDNMPEPRHLEKVNGHKIGDIQ
uniref:Uncharacterized protein n=1 Tax=viral metagenome TaxID=1070528 RepID=A0A6M3IJ60_9ZZZZ